VDGKTIAEEVGFLVIRVNMVGPVLGRGVKLLSIVIHDVVSLLQIKELLQLAV
jgi:hypothetical protein